MFAPRSSYFLRLNPEQDVSCSSFTLNNDKLERCTWKGKIKECEEVEYCSPRDSWRSLAGREGIHYICPQCKGIAERYYWRIS